MNPVTVEKLAVAVEELVIELGQLRTLVPEPELLERLSGYADVAKQYKDAWNAYALAQRIRAWPLTPGQETQNE